MSREDFDSIMKEIAGGFTGDAKTDVKYLKAQAEKYKDQIWQRNSSCLRQIDG